jgi:hypothetical protein
MSALSRAKCDFAHSPNSFRHKCGSVIRKARAGEDQVAGQLGHRRKDLRVTADFGEFEPDYLMPALRALDKWVLKLHRELKRLNSQTNSHDRP